MADSTQDKFSIESKPDELPYYTYRLGHHFEIADVQLACDYYRYKVSPAGEVIRPRAVSRTERIRDMIKDQFPRIPDEDMHRIANFAFDPVDNPH